MNATFTRCSFFESRKLFLFSLCILAASNLWAQSNYTISGKVTDRLSNEPLPGVLAQIQNTTFGGIADENGNYKITAGLQPGTYTIIFSFIGYAKGTELVNLTTQSSVIVNASLEQDVMQLQEVVVTSFGVEKDKKELGFAVQEVSGRELANTTRPNLINSLQGRIAGVSVGSTSGMPGSSSSIVIRGGSSLGGNNQPLFVVDGIPIDNTTLNEGDLLNGSSNRQSDYSSRAADIDPNDIESITVLKGPAAAALYGIDAANGAIIITTKKGSSGAAKINYSSNFRWEKINRFPDLLKGYNVGTGGVNNETDLRHWGAPLAEGDRIYDNVENFFESGFAQLHNLSVSGGNDQITYHASANVNRQDGSVPQTGFDRNSLRLNMTAKLSPKLNLTTSANYIRSESDRTSKGAGSLYQSLLWWPVTDDARIQRNEDGTLKTFVNGDDFVETPFFTVEKNSITDQTDRILLNGSVSYDVLSWLNITGRIGSDIYTTNGLTAYDPESVQRYPNRSRARDVNGLMAEYQAYNKLINSFILVTASKSFNDFNVGLTVGNNIEDREYRVDSRYGENILVPGLYTIINTEQDTREVGVSGSRRRLVGVFGDLKIDYKNMLFLNVTGRNDWSSTLPKDNRSFFYPSVSASFVFSEAFNLDVNSPVSFGKVRASFAQVGKDAPPHSTQPSLREFTRSGGGFNVGFFGANENIEPETTVSYEAGFDIRFFANRLGIDFTYYHLRSDGQIVRPRLSYASGYILQILNAGEIKNEGVEVMINGDILQKNALTWNVNANFSLNRNTVVSLPGDFDEFYLSDTWLAGNARAGYVPGGSYMTITGYTYERNDDGELIIGDDGYPQVDPTFVEIGNREPDFSLGLTNTFGYKGFTLSFLFDIRKGGDIYNATERSLTLAGLSQRTANRGETIVFDGVLESGERNTQEVILDEDYYTSSSLGRVESLFIEKDINWLRLRDVTLSYQLPSSLLSNTFINDVQVNVTGTNLLLWTNYSGADPDLNGLNASARGSNATGFDYFSVPAPTTLAVGVRLGF